MFGNGENKWRESAEERLGEILGEADSDKDPMVFFSRFFRMIEKRAFSGNNPRESWKKIVRFLKIKFPNQIEVVFLDDSGKPVEELVDKPVSKTLTQKFFPGYQAFLREKKVLPGTVQAFMKNFLGPFTPVEHEMCRTLFYASGPPKEGYVYLSDPHSTGMFFLFFKPARPLEEMALKEKLRRLERSSTLRPESPRRVLKNFAIRAKTAHLPIRGEWVFQEPALRICLATRGEKEKFLHKRLGLDDPGEWNLWEALQKSGTGMIWIDDVLIKRRIISPGYWVIGSLSYERRLFSQDTFSIPLVPAFTLLAILVMGITRMIPSKLFFSSVRLKLLALFLYSALVPLLVMGVTAQKLLSERRIVLENETHKDVEKSIRAFDGNFREFTLNLRESLSNHHYTGELSSPDGFPDFEKRFEYYKNKYRFDICRIFDSSGKMVMDFYRPEAPTVFDGPIRFLTKISLRAFKNFTIETPKEQMGKPQQRHEGDLRAPNHSSPVDKTTPATSDRKPSEKDFLDNIVPNISPHSLQEMQVASWEFFLGSFPLGNRQNQMTHYGILMWFRKKMESDYIRNILFSFARNRDQGLFFAWNPDAREEIFPPLNSKTAFLKPFQQLVTSGSSSFRRIVDWQGRPYLLTGLRGTGLKYFSFLCVTSYDKIQGEIDRLRWHGGFISFAILGMCFLITFLLSRFIIEPLGNITQGIAAISRRDFKFQIPVLARDELGNLAEVFNRTMEDLKDLEVARTIQENLFPRAPLVVGNWEIYGTCRPASQVGGDYFDYLPLDGDRALIIIGDVSGHGVGAALVVAMAKALVTRASASMKKPEDLLISLNHLLCAILKRKKMMSCCLAVFHGTSGAMDLVNAGHCSPLMVAGERADFVKSTSYPLGSSKNWKPAMVSLSMEKNRVVIFYSDGLVEALDRREEQIGYERFATKASMLIGENSAHTEALIRAWHADLSPRHPPEDDISMVIVQELKPAVSLA